jgi:DNA-binding transcriptional ArsR family regulator
MNNLKPTARLILALLQAPGSRLTQGQLMDMTATSHLTIARSLSALKAAGLITSTKDGRVTHYALKPLPELVSTGDQTCGKSSAAARVL